MWICLSDEDQSVFSEPNGRVVNDKFDVICDMRISVLALDDLWATGLSVTLDAFALANSFSTQRMRGSPFFHVSVVGVRKNVRSGQGMPIPVKAITPDLKPDWVIVPALNTGTPDRLLPALERDDVKQAKVQLLKWHAEGA